MVIWIAGGLVVGIGAINLALVWLLYDSWQELEHLRIRVKQTDYLCRMAMAEWGKALKRNADRQRAERAAKRMIFDALRDERIAGRVH